MCLYHKCHLLINDYHAFLYIYHVQKVKPCYFRHATVVKCLLDAFDWCMLEKRFLS